MEPERDPDRPTVSPALRLGLLVVGTLAVVALGWLLSRYQTVSVRSASMSTVVFTGDRLVIDRSDRSANRGDVVLLNSPGWREEGTSLYVKRIVATGGQTVSCCDAAYRVLVDGQPLPGSIGEPSVPFASRQPLSSFTVKVPQGRIFVMGDNRSASVDSRAHLETDQGTLPASAVVGHVAFRLWPLSRFGPVDTTLGETLAGPRPISAGDPGWYSRAGRGT